MRPRACWRLARMSFRAGRVAEAWAKIDRLRLEHPESIFAEESLRFRLREQGAGALPWLLKVVAQEQAGISSEALYWVAWVQRPQDLEAASHSLSQLWSRWPESPRADDALWLLSQIQRERGEWLEALSSLEQLTENFGDRGLWLGSLRSLYADDAWYWMGAISLHGLRDQARAKAAWELLLEEAPGSPWISKAKRALKQLPSPDPSQLKPSYRGAP